ncbi:MAG: hypothetical protein JWM78_3213 [Verrucomicrobiaceae bacterium]|nr:hypothetical protein [Verrucomicrobiaceae bacterium]
MKPTTQFEGMRVAGVVLLAALSFMLAACGGSGGGNSANPAPVQTPGGDVSGFQYKGPRAQSPEVQLFQTAFYNNVVPHCGGCHTNGGQGKTAFADVGDVNAAYNAALTVVNLQTPSTSKVVDRVASGHNCWDVSNAACRTQMQGYVEAWATGGGASSTSVKLTAPADRDPNGPDINGDGVGDGFRSFPDLATYSSSNLYGMVKQYCSRCHSDTSSVKQQPYFGSDNAATSFAAIQSKIDLNDPALTLTTLKAKSRLVVRLRDEFHNCWTTNCANDAAAMQSAIRELAQQSPLSLLSSGAYRSQGQTLGDGIVGTSGGRFEFYQIAQWRFLEGEGNAAADTSGVSPAITLTLNGVEGDAGDYHWVGGGGIQFNGAVAYGNAAASKKLFDKIAPVGAYSIEAWVLPSNTADENREIVAYGDGAANRNFMLGQTMYNYDYYNRSSVTNSSGMVGQKKFATPDNKEVLQAALQHVVATYDSVGGRKIYVDGELASDAYPSDLGTLANDWLSSYEVVLGNTLAKGASFNGALRMVSIHNRALTLDQVKQNFAVKPGEKRYVMFNISQIAGMPASCTAGGASNCFVYFEVSQYDNYAYLFNKPYFISLNSDISDLNGLTLKGIRIGVNGKLSAVGQSFIPVKTTVSTANYVPGIEPGSGVLLSDLGTVIPKLAGADADLFYLEFDQIGSSNADQTPAPIVLSFAYVLDGSDTALGVGWRTFDDISAAFSQLTGVPLTASTGINFDNTSTPVTVGAMFNGLRSQLPAVEDYPAYLSSHQTSVTQLAIGYCSALMRNDTMRQSFFTNPSPANFRSDWSANLINPLVNKFMSGGGLASAPANAQISAELLNLITYPTTDATRKAGMCSSGCDDAHTLNAATAACAAALANASITLQ